MRSPKAKWGQERLCCSTSLLKIKIIHILFTLLCIVLHKHQAGPRIFSWCHMFEESENISTRFTLSSNCDNMRKET